MENIERHVSECNSSTLAVQCQESCFEWRYRHDVCTRLRVSNTSISLNQACTNFFNAEKTRCSSLVDSYVWTTDLNCEYGCPLNYNYVAGNNASNNSNSFNCSATASQVSPSWAPCQTYLANSNWNEYCTTTCIEAHYRHALCRVYSLFETGFNTGQGAAAPSSKRPRLDAAAASASVDPARHLDAARLWLRWICHRHLAPADDASTEGHPEQPAGGTARHGALHPYVGACATHLQNQSDLLFQSLAVSISQALSRASS